MAFMNFHGSAAGRWAVMKTTPAHGSEAVEADAQPESATTGNEALKDRSITHHGFRHEAHEVCV